MIATRAHARLSTAKGRRMGESPRVCCQLAAHRRTPPTSNNTASAIAPAIGRAGTGVRSATIENWSPAALGLPALSCDAPAAMSTATVAGGLGRDRHGVGRVVPLQLGRAAVPDDEVLELLDTVPLWRSAPSVVPSPERVCPDSRRPCSTFVRGRTRTVAQNGPPRIK